MTSAYVSGQLVAARRVSVSSPATTGDVKCPLRRRGIPAHSAVQLVDFSNKTANTSRRQEHTPSVEPWTVLSDPITSMMLPPARTEHPYPDATKRWVDNMVNS